MRRIVTWTVCAVFLLVGTLAGAAHLHPSRENGSGHDLHLDHTHLGHVHHAMEPDAGPGGMRAGGCDREPEEGEAFFLGQSAARTSKTSTLPVQALPGHAVVQSPTVSSSFEDWRPGQPRDPPPRRTIRSRAPPA